MKIFTCLFVLLLCGWGIFLLEDGAFNPGALDMKECLLGLLFLLPAFFCLLRLIAQTSGSSPAQRRATIAVLILTAVVYAQTLYSRWQNRDESRYVAVSDEMVIAHIESSNEWMMIDRALLARPAHWYESAVKLTYLSEDRQHARSVVLPAKFIARKSILEM